MRHADTRGALDPQLQLLLNEALDVFDYPPFTEAVCQYSPPCFLPIVVVIWYSSCSKLSGPCIFNHCGSL